MKKWIYIEKNHHTWNNEFVYRERERERERDILRIISTN